MTGPIHKDLPEPLTRALALPKGAQFYRCALQVNPSSYLRRYRGQDHGLDERSYIESLIAKCHALDVQVLAVTDHNHVGEVDAIRSAAHRAGIHVFPGFEATSSEGIHVLCIYATDTPVDKLGRYLGELGIRDPTPSPTHSEKSFSELLACVRAQGGMTIAAHVTHENGLFRALSGQAKIKLWKDPNLLAIQIPGPLADVPHEWQAILRNKNTDYQREPGAAPGVAVAVVNAKDVTEPEDLKDPAATCLIKMSEVSIEGLRQAFLDPDSRIRLNSDPQPEEHAELVAMAWQGGFLDEVAVHFNENLNVLIGGRGAGKSTVLESLRYVLGLNPVGEDSRKSHEGIVRQVLKSGTKISLLIRSHHPIKRYYLVERTIPNPPVVRDETGNVTPLKPSDVLSGVEVYGQHEISELTKSPEKLTRLLERFVQRDAALARRKGELLRELERSRFRILDVRKELDRIEERLAALPGLEETLMRFREAGLEERLKEQSLLVREERVLRTASERITPFNSVLDQFQRNLPIDRAFLSPKALEGLPGQEILSEAGGVLSDFNSDLTDIAGRLRTATERAEQQLGDLRGRWGQRKATVEAEYEQILRELQKSKVDGEEFIRLRRQIEDLRPLKERETALRRDEKEYADHRRNLLVEWEDLKREEYEQLRKAAKKVSRQLARRVRVEVLYAGEREPLFQLLREKVGGQLAKIIEALKERPDLSLTSLAMACRTGRDSLIQQYGLTPSQADRMAQIEPGVCMEIEELDLTPTTWIELNVAPEGLPESWSLLSNLSTGQKATAILLLLLLESDAPLVVDQPEDDLDNRFITDGVVPKMREEKRRRQFVFTTHNANIPVLGDAELIIGLTPSGDAGQGRAAILESHLGSIDARPVRELVEELLEGGKEAFEMRRLKYGF